MCGIVGIASNIFSNNMEQAFKELMVTASLRGVHSSGLTSVSAPWVGAKRSSVPEIEIAKTTAPSYDLVESKRGDQLIKKSGKGLLLGHARWATMGKLVATNAHPFLFDGLVGVHNGTIRSKIPEQDSFGTDSEALYNSIATLGVEETIANTDGAYALVYFDSDDNTLNFLRNDERELWFCHNKDGQDLYWASEKGMLEWVLFRNKISVSDEGIRLYKANALVSYTLFSGTKISDTTEVREIKGKEVKHVTYQGPFRGETMELQNGIWRASEFGRNIRERPTVIHLPPPSTTSDSTKTIDAETKEEGEETSSSVIDIKTARRGYKGKLIGLDYYKTILSGGCCWCGRTDAKPNEPIRFVSEEEFLCSHCKSHDDVVSLLSMSKTEIRTLS